MKHLFSLFFLSTFFLLIGCEEVAMNPTPTPTPAPTPKSALIMLTQEQDNGKTITVKPGDSLVLTMDYRGTDYPWGEQTIPMDHEGKPGEALPYTWNVTETDGFVTFSWKILEGFSGPDTISFDNEAFYITLISNDQEPGTVEEEVDTKEDDQEPGTVDKNQDNHKDEPGTVPNANLITLDSEQHNETSIAVEAGDILTLSLDYNASTGYQWKDYSDPMVQKWKSEKRVPKETDLIGAGGIVTYSWKIPTDFKGPVTISLGYEPPGGLAIKVNSDGTFFETFPAQKFTLSIDNK
jgi:predicted secreted protein